MSPRPPEPKESETRQVNNNECTVYSISPCIQDVTTVSPFQVNFSGRVGRSFEKNRQILEKDQEKPPPTEKAASDKYEFTHHPAFAEVHEGISGIGLDAMIDTGASCSIISLQALNAIKKSCRRRRLEEPKVEARESKIIGVTDHDMKTTEVATLALRMGSFTFEVEALVSDPCPAPILLGNPFLEAWGIIADVGSGLIRFSHSEETLPLRCTTKQQPIKALLASTVVIPPHSQRVVALQVIHPEKETRNNQIFLATLLETAYQQHRIVAAKTLIDLNNPGILVANLSDKEIIIPQGSGIASIQVMNADEARIQPLPAGFSPTDEMAPRPDIKVAAVFTVKERIIEPPSRKKPSKSKGIAQIDLGEAEKHLKTAEIQALQALLKKHSNLWEKVIGLGNAQDVATRTPLEHHVDTGDKRPVHMPPYREGPKHREIIQEHVKKMLDDEIIEPSRSNWSSPVVLAPKPNGGVRFCVDFRKLNEITEKDVYPLPRIDDLLHAMKEARYFTTLDLLSGYWQIPLTEESKAKTAFITSQGLYQFKVMPFGLTNAPATFQRMMDVVLAGLKWQCCLVYLDDVIIFSPTFEQHMQDLEKCFERLAETGLVLSPEKTHICRQEVHYLGHVLSATGLATDPRKAEAVRDFPVPTNPTDVKSFLGLAGYYRRFIIHFSARSTPLTELTKDDIPFVWSDACQKAFDDIKQALISAPILRHPDFGRPFLLDTDACKYGLGAILMQVDTDSGAEYVVCYASRKLNPAEQKWNTTEQEALAIIWAIEHFRSYLLGTPFIVRSDHSSLQWLYKAKHGRLARWALRVQEFSFEIHHRAGKKNPHADALSRSPVGDMLSVETMDQETPTRMDQDSVATTKAGQQQWKNTKKKVSIIASQEVEDVEEWEVFSPWVDVDSQVTEDGTQLEFDLSTEDKEGNPQQETLQIPWDWSQQQDVPDDHESKEKERFVRPPTMKQLDDDHAKQLTKMQPRPEWKESKEAYEAWVSSLKETLKEAERQVEVFLNSKETARKAQKECPFLSRLWPIVGHDTGLPSDEGRGSSPKRKTLEGTDNNNGNEPNVHVATPPLRWEDPITAQSWKNVLETVGAARMSLTKNRQDATQESEGQPRRPPGMDKGTPSPRGLLGIGWVSTGHVESTKERPLSRGLLDSGGFMRVARSLRTVPVRTEGTWQIDREDPYLRSKGYCGNTKDGRSTEDAIWSDTWDDRRIDQIERQPCNCANDVYMMSCANVIVDCHCEPFGFSSQPVCCVARLSHLVTPIINEDHRIEEESRDSQTKRPFYTRKELGKFRVYAGLLYRVDLIQGWPCLRLCIPLGLVAAFATYYHHATWFSHVGIKRTLDLLTARYFWPRMKATVEAVIGSCDVCQRRKAPSYRLVGPLNRLTKEGPWDTIGIDIYGPLPKAASGHQFIIVCMDHFSKWPELFPCRNITSKEVAQAIYAVVCRHGCPRRILTDLGRQFLSRATKDLCLRLGVHKVFTSAYYPQGDGIAEAFMKILGSQLATLVQDNHTNWPKYLDQVAMAYRVTPHPATGETPAYLLHGYDIRLPLDNQLELLSEAPVLEEFQIDTMKRLEVLREARKTAMDNLYGLYQKAAAEREERVNIATHNVGQLVYVRVSKVELRKEDSHKLADRWTGPYRIVEVYQNEMTYKLCHLHTNKEKVVHYSNLKVYNPLTPQQITERLPFTVSLPKLPPQHEDQEIADDD